MKKAAGIPHLVEVVLEFGGGVISSVVGAYLYDKLQKHKGNGIRTIVERREIHFTKSEITKVIEERIETKESK